MKHVKFLGFVFLALYLVILGVVGLFGIVNAFVPTLLSLLALVAGVLFFFSIGSCCASGKCDYDKHDRDVINKP